MKSSKPSFRSYLPPAESSFPSRAEVSRVCEAALLPGELVVSETSNVRKCIATDTSAHDLYGTLLCTNFKISFITKDVTPFRKFQYRNLLLEEHDISLTCVDQVVAVNDERKKRKVLGPNQCLKFKPTELIIYCKDFRIIRFRFDESIPESARKICLVIAHYSQPKDLQLLFGFAYAGEKCQTSVNGTDPEVDGLQTSLFETYSDWDREIKRTGASEWRVCSVNEHYATSTSLPEYFVVPSSLADEDLKQLVPSFNGDRIPMWCWYHWTGSALVRMANIKPGPKLRKHNTRILKAIAQSHPEKSEVFKSDLDKNLPSISEVQAALVRLKQMCINDFFDETDEKWLSSLENTQWLEYVRLFLKHSAELAQWMYNENISVIIQEEEGRDLSCVIASVIQVMADPHFRTMLGFQSLMQKEWVVAGYRFLDRCNHLGESEKHECPLFLLFLDCVWQLLQQFPAAFEFTETYLTVLYDSVRIPLFGTFLFNTSHQRIQQSQDFATNRKLQCEGKGLELPSVWNWSLQFTAKDLSLFNNPLYIGKSVTCVQNGTIKSFRRVKKNSSSSIYSVYTMKNGKLSDQHDFFPRRNSIQRPSLDLMQLNESHDRNMERYFRDWFSKPVDLHGLIMPHLSSVHIQLWKQCYLRWIPEAQITNGGSISAFHKISLLADEIETLQQRLRQYWSDPCLSGSPEPCGHRMYFRAKDFSETPGELDCFSSSFPFSPVGNLCRRSILGTPLSKFLLTGAKTWPSTETLANED
ncbi:myotubularin-related protein 10 isoform X2 [Scyliorhinus canicula]|uniref:myotubularin-related protein 10 isoform X2 n=1 Tax=Scyliorhinus canicula TaxID=7830 RepID=UPI0018F46125|nr:myotubularin-related protein 10 isoform X2 [Scyliorhinus canicula]